MTCNCIKEFETKMLTEGFNKKKIVKVDFLSVALVGPGVAARTFSEMSIQYEGQKKAKEFKVFHNYCPFCGKKTTDK